jgi:hypothetical protein
VRKGCLYGVIGVLGLCVVACALGYFVALPRVRESAREPIEEVIGTQIALHLAPIPGAAPAPGTYEISEDDLNTALLTEIAGNDLFDDVAVSFTPAGFELRFTANESDVSYSGNVTAVDGRLEVTDVSGDGWMTTFLRAGDVENAFENVVNDYLAANNLLLTNAELGDGVLSLTTEAA